ncbi:hypothetical protein VTO42DRAFT_6833 [Malbranchea cinnamomea]
MAHLHALTAASLAMQRHSQRSSGDSGGLPDQVYGTHVVQPLHRTPSSRYSDSNNYAGFDGENGGLTPSQRLCTRESSLEPVPELPVDAREFGLEERVLSQPSSYRRLRKVKSMVPTRQRDAPTSSVTASHSGFAKSTLRRSLSFFKVRTGSIQGRHAYTDCQDVALQLARDQFLDDLEEQRRLRNLDSVTSRRQNQPRPFRKSFRSTSIGHSKVDNELSKGQHHGIRSRFFSVSIKHGLRRIFGRLSTSQDEKSATFTSPRRFRSSNTESPQSSSRATTNNDESLRLEPSHPESTAYQAGSLRTTESSESVCTSGSRATSWADSSAVNRHEGGGQSQLSVIREDGDASQLEQTARAPSVASYHDGYSVFRQPLAPGRSESRTREIMDSQRVYSALMRHIDQASSEITQGDDATPKPTRTMKSGLGTPSTVRSIRHVPSSVSATCSTSLSASQMSPNERSRLSVRKPNYLRDSFRFTPQQVAQHNESFNSSHEQKCSDRSQSISVAAPITCGQGFSTSAGSEIDSEDDTETVMLTRQDASFVVPQSPSVYSRTTSDNGPYEDDSDDDRGTVTILANHRVPYSPRKENVAHSSDKVEKTSGEWKEWMNSQMDIINVTPVVTDFPRTHYREETQIDDDGFRVEQCTGGQANEFSFQQTTDSEIRSTEQPRLPLTELPCLSQRNFSRPSRRVSSAQISLRSTSVGSPSIVSASYSPAVTPVVASTSAQSTSQGLSRTPMASGLAYYKTRQSESPRLLTTPRRDPQRNQNTDTPQSRYGLSSAIGQPAEDVRRQSHVAPLTVFRNRREDFRMRKENQRLQNNGSPVRRHGMKNNNFAKLEGIHSTISSKRMVDIFLSDRRRMLGSSEDDGLSSEPAFL